MALHRALRHEQAGRDLGIGQPLPQDVQYFGLLAGHAPLGQHRHRYGSFRIPMN